MAAVSRMSGKLAQCGPDHAGSLLASPEGNFTRINGSKLWHLALLEWWLHVHVDRVDDGVQHV